MTAPRLEASRVAKLPLVLLACLSVVTFAGPFGLGWVLSGGRERAWPPDRPVEWVAFTGLILLATGLFVATLALNLANLRAMKIEAERARTLSKDLP